MKTRLILLLLLLLGVEVRANDTFVSLIITNDSTQSADMSVVVSSITVNGTSIYNGIQNYPMYPNGGAIAIVSAYDLGTNQTMVVTVAAMVYDTNGVNFGPPYWDGLFGGSCTASPATYSFLTVTMAWQAGVTYPTPHFIYYVPDVAPPCTEVCTAYGTDSYTNQILVTITNAQIGSVAYTYNGPLANASLGSWELLCDESTNFFVTYSNLPIALCPVVFNVMNSASVPRIFGVSSDGTAAGVIAATEALIGVNQSFYYSNSVPCSLVSSYQLFAQGIAGGGNLAGVSIGANVSDTGAGTNLGNGVSTADPGNTVNNAPNGGVNGGGSGGVTNSAPVVNSPPPVYSPTNAVLPVVAGSTNQLIWSSTNTSDLTQLIPAIQTSGQAIWAAVNTGISQQHSDANGVATAVNAAAGQNTNSLGALQSQSVANANGVIAAINSGAGATVGAVNGVGAMIGASAVLGQNAVNGSGAGLSNGLVNIAGILHGISNGVVAGLTNSPGGETNYALETTQDRVLATDAGMSNLLAGIYSNTLPGTNSFTNYSLTLPDSATNSDAATSAGNALNSGLTGGLTGWLDAVAGGNFVIADPGHTAGWSFEFFGSTLDLDPIDMFPWVCTFSLGVWAFLLVAAYLFFAQKLYAETLSTMAGARGTSVPNMDIVGTNVAGVAVVAVLPFVFLTIWGVFLAVVLPGVEAYWTYFTGIGSVFSTASSASPSGAMAVHLLVGVFPLGLALNLVVARLVLMVTVNRAAVVAIWATRFLVGG